MFDLQAHGADTFVGTGPRYPWGGLYGGQIVAQALRAAGLSVDHEFLPHSIRAYFIRPGDHTEPVRYEVDRTRNGRSFLTRRVIARQAIGAILNAECSFQRPEESASLQSVGFPIVPPPDDIENTSFSAHFDRRFIEPGDVRGPGRDGAGRVTAWMRVLDPIPEVTPDDEPFLHQCWLAYVSDDLASDTVRAAHLTVYGGDPDVRMSSISLDHTVWFHRPMRADRWHLHDFTCHHYTGARGLAIGHVFDAAGAHVATIAQEVLRREPRES
ncbi:MAG TPA: acyl-CoA thioesterase domain-containing protein [Ilumatobacter sp.]